MMINYNFYVEFCLINNFMNPYNFPNVFQNKIITSNEDIYPL
jgi:hypothetical protein